MLVASPVLCKSISACVGDPCKSSLSSSCQQQKVKSIVERKDTHNSVENSREHFCIVDGSLCQAMII